VEQPISPDKGIADRKALVSKVASGQIVTTTIPKDELTSYLMAAKLSGFKVEKIAGEGEEFPRWFGTYENRTTQAKYGYRGGLQRTEPVSVKVQGKGYIAVSVEKPEGSKDSHDPFWRNLESLEPKKT